MTPDRSNPNYILWLFRNGVPVGRHGKGLDTVEIAQHLKMTEARVAEMLAFAREARRLARSSLEVIA